MTPRRLLAASIPALLAAACSASPPSIPGHRALPAPAVAAPRARPARWLAPDAELVERTPDGLDHVVAGGRRLALRGLEVVEAAPASPEVQGGAVAPPWAGAGPQRYVFWRGRALYGAASFSGELHPLAALPADPRGSFDWLGGVGLRLAGGAAVVAPGGGGLTPLPIPAASHGVAADARRALVVDALGRASLTLDGGATFRDVSSELGAAPHVEVIGEALAASSRGGQPRFVLPSGEVVGAYAARGPDLRRRPDLDQGAWPLAAGPSALDAAVSSGLPLPDGGAVIVGRGFVGRLDLTTLRATSVAPIPGAAAAECAPIRQGSAVLLACSDQDRALVVDVTGAPILERTFDAAGPLSHDRFAGSDGEGLGYLGPCDAASPASPRAAALPEDPAASPGRSAVFCARASRDVWVEHALDPDDAASLFAWIPRANGGAVALVVAPGTFVPEARRVEVRGALRVVRVARGEPPLNVPAYVHRAATALNAAFRVGADDVIEGWLPTASATAGLVSVSVDARGRVYAYPTPPRATPLRVAGAFALAATDDDKLFESTDRGHTWAAVEPPPGAASASYGGQCSAVGCRVGDFVRLGWSGPDAAAPPPAARRPRPSASRAPPTPLVALRCHVAGPAVARRPLDTRGFGVPPLATPPRAGLLRLGAQGAFQIPASGPLAPTLGDAEVAWIPPLVSAAPIRRVTVSLSAPGLAWPTQRPYEARLAYLLDPRGGLELMPVGRDETCLAGLLDRAGVTRPFSACVGDLSVGVDLGDRLIVVQPSSDSLLVSSAPSSARPTTLHELARLPVATTRGFSFGVGARAKAPILITVDVLGEAALTPLDPALGAPERLRPLTALTLGSDAACKGPSPSLEARVVLPFVSSIGLDRAALPGLFATGTGGVAVIRWSRARACLDAVEILARDERYDADLSSHDPPGAVRKLIARFDGERAGKGPNAGLALITSGSEIRQPLFCDGIAPAAP